MHEKAFVEVQVASGEVAAHPWSNYDPAILVVSTKILCENVDSCHIHISKLKKKVNIHQWKIDNQVLI